MAVAGRRRRVLRWLLALMLLLGVALAVLWTQRRPIARDFIDSHLAEKGVRGSYDITEFGVRRQRIERLVLGDPADPDLTADWVELRFGLGFGMPHVAAIHAGGVRLRGRLKADGTVSFGVLDRLMPAPSGEPFALPDIRLVVDDARMRLETAHGAVGLKLDGHGPLRDGFQGKLAAIAPRLAFGDCVVDRATLYADIRIADRSPAIAGPVRLAAVDCPGIGVQGKGGNLLVDAALTEAFDAWTGNVRLELAEARYAGNRLSGATGRIDFDGNAQRTRGGVKLAAAGFVLPQLSGTGLKLAGDYDLAGDGSRFAGKAGAASARLADTQLAALRGMGASGAGTPAGPIVAALSAALVRAGENLAVDAVVDVERKGPAGSVRLSALNVEAASGARIGLTDGDGVRFLWPAGAARLDGTLSLSGGGLPEGRINLVQRTPGGPLSGEAVFQPYAAGGARLALAPVRFEALADGARFDTRITLDGPLADGRVEGLTMPLSGLFDTRGNLVVNRGCAPLDWRQVSVAGMVLRPARLRLCPVEGGALIARANGRLRGGASIEAPRLAGRVGGSPLSLAASGAQLRLGDGVLGLGDVAVRLGAPDSESRLDIGRLDGRIAGDGVAGRFQAVSGKIGAVPLLISEGAGDWRLRGGALALEGALRVADEAVPPRFQPLQSRDFTLALVDGRIDAKGSLVEPVTGVKVSDVAILHRLGPGTGRADLVVSGLRFGDALQPEQLTTLTLGVVANVKGRVDGQGRIEWSPNGVTSSGDFRTDELSLAAAFGPVDGLSGTIHFTDLLALETAPGQVVRLREVNPGIPVNDGEIRYQLLSGQRVKVEGGRWPFAGGELILDPAVLDMGNPVERHMTFRVVGMEAASFINRMEFDNLSATGKFDGVLPMIFDETGGRIVGGFLKVREEGGTLAYVGEVTNADLNFFARIAFDALKSIRYKRLTIGMNGAIDGELVSDIRFDGVNQQGIQQGKGGLFEQILGRQFIFNIKISAPFRGLLTTAKSFYDPSILIRDALPPPVPPAANPVPATPRSVQPQESEQLP